jgi:hypothetical protein
MTLVPQASLEELAINHNITLADLLDRLAEAQGPQPERETPRPQVKIAISDAQRSTLRRLATQLADVELPEAPRLLSEDEKREYIRLFDQVKDARSAVEAAEKALKETFCNHLDVESKGAYDALSGPLEIDASGHVLAAGEVVAAGESKKVTRELRGGKANGLTIADLQFLESEGKIDHATYLAMTETVPAQRRVDEAKIMDVLAKRPALIAALAEVATLSERTSAIYLRKNS